MFILTSEQHGGVYAVNNKDGLKTVQIFEEEDDAIRYLGLLEADENFDDILEVTEVEKDIVTHNCSVYGYNYCLIKSDDIVIPPQ